MENIDIDQQIEILKEILKAPILNEREKNVLRFRYFCAPPFTYKEIGIKMEVTGERTRQIKCKAERKIKYIILWELWKRKH